MGCDEQNGLPDSMGKMQRQPLAQGLLTPQVPPQVARALGPFRNCRAETIPAHKTSMRIAAKKVDLIFFLMIAFFSWFDDRRWARYFAGVVTPVGCDEQNPVVDSSGKAQMQPLGQGGLPTPQLPWQANPLLWLRNWRAETVPAQRTLITKAV
jgi:hypothetical protein